GAWAGGVGGGGVGGSWRGGGGGGVGVEVGVGAGAGVGAGVGLAFDVFTLVVPVPVLPLEARTPIESECVPWATFVVSIGIDNGPLPPACVASVCPSTLTVNVLLPLEPFTHTTAHDVPLSAAPDVG